MAPAQFEVRTDWPTPRHMSVKEVRVRSETSSLAPIRFVDKSDGAFKKSNTIIRCKHQQLPTQHLWQSVGAHL